MLSSTRTAAHGPNRLGVRDLQIGERRRLLRGVIALVAISVFALLLDELLGSTGVLFGLVFIGGAIAVAGLTVWLWQNPVRGVYVLFAAAVAIDVDYTVTTENGYYIAHYLPFWQDFTAWTRIHIIVSPAELFMVLLLIIWLIKSTGNRNFRFQKGSLMLPIGLYMGMILVGELHGVGTGGNLTVSLWELRPQIYMLIAYILACNLVRTRNEIMKLSWILLIGAGFRAIEGTARYFTFFRGHVQQEIAVFPHGQAFFLNGFLTLTAILFLYNGPRKMKRVALWLLPFVLFIDLATDRRAAIAALSLGTLLLLFVTLIVNPARRRLVGIILVLLAVTFPPYYLKFQNSAGTIAVPARAIASQFHPDPRDASSNQYRIDEAFDIMSTMKSSTTTELIGYGFGKPFQTPHALADISQIYVFWNVMPHNSILWVWMRLGTVGFLLLWLMIGAAILQSLRLARRMRDPWLQGLAVFVALMIVQEVVFGYLDLQWTDYRNLVTVGLLFALISRLAKLAEQERSLAPDDTQTRPPAKATVSAARSLAVIDGRLKRISA